MLTIDAQVHAYERNHPGRPGLRVLRGPAEVTGDEMVAAMDAVGVDGALLVSPFAHVSLRRQLRAEVYAAHPGRFGLIKPVDPNDPAVADTIADWAATQGHRRRSHHAESRGRFDRCRRSRHQPGPGGGRAAFAAGEPAGGGGWSRLARWRRVIPRHTS